MLAKIKNIADEKDIIFSLERVGLDQIAKKLNENGYVDYKQELPNTMKDVYNKVENGKLELVGVYPHKYWGFILKSCFLCGWYGYCRR